MEPNDVIRSRNWHYNYNNERELPLIQFCLTSINPERPIALAGWNCLVIMKKMGLQLNALEDDFTFAMHLPLPDGSGQTVWDVYQAARVKLKPQADS